MSDEFTHHVLRMVVARICQPLGVHGMQNSVCDALADILKNYLLTLGKTTAAYSWHGEMRVVTALYLLHTYICIGCVCV